MNIGQNSVAAPMEIKNAHLGLSVPLGGSKHKVIAESPSLPESSKIHNKTNCQTHSMFSAGAL